jgi:hypothetical protein
MKYDALDGFHHSDWKFCVTNCDGVLRKLVWRLQNHFGWHWPSTLVPKAEWLKFVWGHHQSVFHLYVLNIQHNSCWRADIAQSIKWKHRAIQLKFDQLSAAVVFLPPCPYWSSVLLLHVRVKQPDMWNWPPSCVVKNEWTWTSISFYAFIIPLATGRTSPWWISAWKFRTPGRDFQKSFW